MVLNIIWFILIVILFCGYIVLDGFDFGVGMSHFLARTDEDRRINLNAIGPLWDGNEVWLVTAGGALFAAFPDVYATVFSGFYIAFMLFLLVIIFRAVSIEFRSKVDSSSWKQIWDFLFCLSSYLIALLLGVALGNIISGIPVGSDKEFMGNFFTLLHPYALFLGLTAVALLRLHGLIYITMKTEGDLRQRYKSGINRAFFIFLIFYIIHTIWTLAAFKQMSDKFISYPFLFIIPLLIVLALVLIPLQTKKDKLGWAFMASSFVIVANIVIVAIGIFPNLVLSTLKPEYSLNIYDHSSSPLTLKTMLIIACIGLPLVAVYSFVIYKTFKGKVKIDSMSY